MDTKCGLVQIQVQELLNLELHVVIHHVRYVQIFTMMILNALIYLQMASVPAPVSKQSHALT